MASIVNDVDALAGSVLSNTGSASGRDLQVWISTTHPRRRRDQDAFAGTNI